MRKLLIIILTLLVYSSGFSQTPINSLLIEAKKELEKSNKIILEQQKRIKLLESLLLEAKNELENSNKVLVESKKALKLAQEEISALRITGKNKYTWGVGVLSNFNDSIFGVAKFAFWRIEFFGGIQVGVTGEEKSKIRFLGGIGFSF